MTLGAGVLVLLPGAWHSCLARVASRVLDEVQEIRVRRGQPVILYGSFGEAALTPAGLSSDLAQALIAEPEDVAHLLATVSQNSLYALEDELRSGYVTVPGGHRVGLSGRVVTEGGRVRTLKYISGFNIRVAREVKGCAEGLLPRLLSEQELLSTLLVGPPQSGKTTMLRDLVRGLSTGSRGASDCATMALHSSTAPVSNRGFKVAVVDERSELAACYQGVPQLDVGPRADVLDACPKAEGMQMALRALGPEVIATDEIGKAEDAEAVWDALHAGVAVLTTAHGTTVEEVRRRPMLRQLLTGDAFQRVVILSSRRGPGTVEAVLTAADLRKEDGVDGSPS